MKEVRDLTIVLADAVKFIRKAHADAKDTLAAEIGKARANVDKINSMTREFKEANLELEEFISGTGSNFPPEGIEGTEGDISKMISADRNGVTLNKE